jgi:hypothetical protein
VTANHCGRRITTGLGLAVWLVSGATFEAGGGQVTRRADFSALAPFFEAEEMRVANGIAVGLFYSLTDQRSLYAVQLETGMELARIDDVGQAVFDFDGNRVVYASQRQNRLISLDLGSHRSDQIWEAPSNDRIQNIHVSGSDVSLAVESDEGIYAVVLDTVAVAQAIGPLLPPPAESVDTFVASGSLFVLPRAGGRGAWSRGAEGWKTVAIPANIHIVALSANRLLGVDVTDSSKLWQASLTTDQDLNWETAYKSTSRILVDSVHVEPDEQVVGFLEGSGPNIALVRLGLDASHNTERTELPARVALPDRAAYGWSSDYFVWPQRRDGRLYLSAVPVVHPMGAVPASRPLLASSSDRDVSDMPGFRALEWLRKQMGPEFTSRAGQRARLIDSYEDAERAGWVYDAAVAAIAFTASGHPALAQGLLGGLEHLQEDDGAWRFSYDPDSALPRGSERYSGSIAWVVMAANFYEWDTADRRFAPMATRALAYLERSRITDVGSELYGGFAMGPDKPDVFSTEHNADCYAAFLWRGRLENDAHDQAVAEDIRNFILREIWRDGAAPREAFFKVGARDSSLYLDAQTWTTLAFGGTIDKGKLEEALLTAEHSLVVNSGRLNHVEGIVGFDDTGHAPGEQKVWAEGTEGMVAALLSIGQVQRARRYHLATAGYQDASGGVPYATERDPGWRTVPAVASTAWFVLNRLSPPRNPFNPDVNSWREAHALQEQLIVNGQ